MNEKEKLKQELKERLKELKTIYKFSQIVEKEGIKLEGIYKKLANIIPKGYQYPGIASAVIKVKGEDYKSKRFKKSNYCQSAPIKINGKKEGFIQVCYSKKKKFLNQELKMLNAISERLGRIIERKTAQKLIKKSEKKYQRLTESINDIIYSMNPDGKITYISPQVKKYGYAQEDFVGKNIIKHIIPKDRPRVLKDAMRTWRTGEEFPTIFRIKDKKGKIVWMEERGKVVKDSKGKVVSTIGVIRDITKTKKLNDELEKSREAYKSIFESSPEAIVVIDKKGKITNINNRVTEWLGYKTKNLIGKSLMQLPFLSLKNKAIIVKKFAERLLGKKLEPYDVEFLTKKKKKKIGRIRGAKTKHGALILITDVTKELENQRLIEASEKKYRDLFENSTDLIQSCDLKGRIIEVNNAWMQIMGYERKDLKGLNLKKIVAKESLKHCMKLFKEVIGGESINNISAVFKTKEGEKIFVEGSAQPLIKNEEIVGSWGIFRNVTLKKRFEEVKVQQERTRMSLSLRNQFLNQVSHELRHPLVPIIGYSSTILEEKNLTSEQKKNLKKVLDNANQLKDLINKLISSTDFKIEEVKKSKKDIGKLLKQVLNGYEKKIKSKGLHFKKKIKNNVMAKINSEKIKQSIKILFDNAVKNTSKGFITFELKEDGDNFYIIIQDSGKGIPEKELEKIEKEEYSFEKDYSTFYKGFSLGLMIVKQTVKLHEGRIEFNSKKGKGTKIKLRIPK